VSPDAAVFAERLAALLHRRHGTSFRALVVSWRHAQSAGDARRIEAHTGRYSGHPHRTKLLGAEVVFEDLGLLAVDEDQRFKVKNKERRLARMVDLIDMGQREPGAGERSPPCPTGLNGLHGRHIARPFCGDDVGADSTTARGARRSFNRSKGASITRQEIIAITSDKHTLIMPDKMTS
jgi:hypothetical protein